MPVPGLTLGFRTFRLSRQGYVLAECQDASAGDPERGRFAIADGAAESPYAALWARLLVDEFVRQSQRLSPWADWLPSLQARWAAEVARLTGTLPGQGEASSLLPLAPSVQAGWHGGWTGENGVPWYLEPGLLQGAFATFLGLVIEEEGWHALAVGDSCLFQVRQGELVRSFPITRAADFGNAPWLVGSRTSPGEVPLKYGVQTQGDWVPRDRFWLMTDALAQWFLGRVEAGGKPWLVLDPLLHNAGGVDAASEAFAAWVEGLRAARQLRNDDVTLLAVSL
jgi:hypothetical protein